MKAQVGEIVITVQVDAYEDEDGEVTIDGRAKPELSVSIDLPVGADAERRVAIKYLRNVADSLEAAS